MTEDPHAPARVSPARTATGGLPNPPLHPLSSLLMAVFDGLWSIPEFIAAASVVGLPLVPFLAAGSGATCALAVLVGQGTVGRDAWHMALVKGLVAGLAAAIPIPLTGTVLGCLCLIWSGLVFLSSSEGIDRSAH